MTRKSDTKTFGIVGYGRFGRLWAKELSRFGRVLVCDEKPVRGKTPRGVSVRPLPEVARADFLFIAVPISRLEECCDVLSPLLSPKTIVLDACSVKVWPAATMKRLLPKNQPILGTHPLFGPDSARLNGGIAGLKIVVCPVRVRRKALQEVLSIFRKLSLTVISSTPAEHDRSMARSQALVHFIGRGLAGLKLRAQEIATPDYGALLRMQDMVLNDTWELFSDMQERNPFASPIRESFMESLERLDAGITTGNDSASLRRGIERVDRGLLTLLACRTTLSRSIGKLKKAKGLPVRDRAREQMLQAMRAGRAKALGLDSFFVEKVFASVIRHSRNLQHSRSV